MPIIKEQLLLNLPHRAAQGREDFFVAPSNQAAVEMIDNWRAWQPPILLLVGAAASGKSHLAKVWQAQSGAASFYESPDASFLLADDIDSQRQTIDEGLLFERLNYILHSKSGEAALLLTARSLDWWRGVALADLRSRLATLPTIEIASPDEHLIAALLLKFFADRQLQVSESLIYWLMTRIERDCATAYACVETLDKESARRGKPLTIALAREVLF